MDAIRTVGELKQALEQFPDDWPLLIHIPGEVQPPEEIRERGFRTDLRRSETWTLEKVQHEYVETPRVRLRAGEIHRPTLAADLRLMELTLKYSDRLFSGMDQQVSFALEHLLQQGKLAEVDQIPAEYELLRGAFQAVLEKGRND